MISLTIHKPELVRINVANPTVNQVVQAIQELDGINTLGADIRIDRQYLGMDHAQQSRRLHIRFTVLKEGDIGLLSSRILMDDTQKSQETLDFLLSNGQVDQLPIQETVDLHTAIEIASYFVEHGEMPQGLNWEPPELVQDASS